MCLCFQTVLPTGNRLLQYARCSSQNWAVLCGSVQWRMASGMHYCSAQFSSSAGKITNWGSSVRSHSWFVIVDLVLVKLHCQGLTIFTWMQDVVVYLNLVLKYVSHLKFTYEVPYQTTLGQTMACFAKLSHVDERENRACCSSISSDLGAF
jgi:hypothetical protein